MTNTENESMDNSLEESLDSMTSEEITNFGKSLKEAYRKGETSLPKKEKKSEELSDKDRIASLEKQIKDLEKIKNDRGGFIEKQAAMINSKQDKILELSEKLKQLEEASSENSFWENPEKAMDARDEKKKTQQELEELTKEQRYFNNKQKLQQLAPDYDSLIDDIVDYFKEIQPDMPQEVIDIYKKDPYDIVDPEKFMQHIIAARMIKRFKSPKSEKQETVQDKIKSAAAHATATSNLGSQLGSNLEDMDISELSAEALAEYSAKLKKKYRESLK